ncbi:transglycosylase SLT domain-containing protein [Microbacterium sp. RD1]|uniref:aggregation-promoting factor C-terminal-like domain-containing protein n=1 Tax=Microbacterium sp. RD1 TaxID=3457313 RepID=UPI003FA528E4
MTRATSGRIVRRTPPGAVDVVPPPTAPRRAPRWSRRRGVLAGFAAFAALGFVAAYVGPTGAALAEVETASVSMYKWSEGDAQTWSSVVAEREGAASLDRAGYSVYVTPKPTPTPTAKATSGGAGSAPSRPQYTGGGSPAEWMAAAGIPESDWGYVDYIAKRESGWNPNATNKSSGACGLIQAYPCSKVPGNGYDPVDNLRWANGYANGRYGSWASAYDFWTRNHWW